MFPAEALARAPASTAAALGATPTAAAAPLPIGLKGSLASRGCAYQPSYELVDYVRKRAVTQKVVLLWVSPCSALFLKTEWVPTATPTNDEVVSGYIAAAAALGSVNADATLSHVALERASTLANSGPKASMWIGSRAEVIHSMAGAWLLH